MDTANSLKEGRPTAQNEALQRQAAIEAAALSILRGLSQALSQPWDVNQILGDVLVHCLDAAGLAIGLLYVRGPDGRPRLQAQFGIPAESIADAETCFGHADLIHRIVETAEPVAFSSATENMEERDFLARLGHSSVLIMPFVVLGQTFGELVLASDNPDLSESASAWLGFARSLSLQFGQTVELAQSRERGEEALRRSEATMKSVLDAALDAVIMMDAQGRVTSWNRRAEELFGWSSGEAVGEILSELIIPPRYREAHQKGLARFLATGDGPAIGRRIELSAVRRDGSEFPVDVTVTALEEGGVYYFNAFLADITERKRAEEALREAQRRLEHVVSSSPAVLYSLKPRGDVLVPMWVSANLERLMGYAPEELRLPEQWSDRIHPDDRERVIAEVATLLSDGFVAREYRFRHKDGSYRWVRDQQRLLRDAEGRPTEVVGSWSDVSARKEAELQLAMDVTEKRSLEAQLRQSQKMESVGRLAGGVAHDFNNILGVITGYAELLRRRLPSEPPQWRKYTDDILSAAGRAADLTRQLLAFSRSQVLQPRILDLNEHTPLSAAPAADASSPRGTETVLIVEDEGALREIIRECLESSGYAVLEAPGAAAAIETCEGHQGAIQLLLSDVVMPGADGRALANQLATRRPDMKVLYMSGYTDDAVIQHGVLTKDMPFLEKPFTCEALARKVREVLDRA